MSAVIRVRGGRPARSAGSTRRARIGHSRWAVLGGFAVAAVLLFAVAPAVLTPFRLDLLGKYLCYAIVAVGIGLAWGRGGMLTLGQGVFFGIGAYLMAMHLKLADAGPERDARLHGADLVGPACPAGGSRSGPGWSRCWRSCCCPRWSRACSASRRSAAGSAAPTSRSCRQALAAAFAILLVGNPKSTGGSTGLNNFRGFFGFNLYDPLNKQMLFFIAVRRAAGDGRAGPPAHGQPLRRAAGGLPRLRGARALPRLRPGERQDRGLHGRGVHGGHRRGALRADRRHRLAQRRGHRPVDRLPHRRGDRRADDVARAGARRDRGGLGGHDALGVDPLGLDLHPGLPVHAGHRVPAGRPGVAAGGGGGRAGAAARPPPPSPVPVDPAAGDGGGEGREQGLPGDHRPHGLLRRVRGRRRRGPVRAARRPALPHRTERRGQDHADRRRVRAGAGHRARRTFGGRELIGQKVHRIARLGVGRTFQTATVFEELTVLQNLDIAAGRPARRADAAAPRGPGCPTRSRRRWRRSGSPSSPTIARRASCRTGRSSGSRSGCCWCRTRSCSCSTSRWPG